LPSESRHVDRVARNCSVDGHRRQSVDIGHRRRCCRGPGSLRNAGLHFFASRPKKDGPIECGSATPRLGTFRVWFPADKCAYMVGTYPQVFPPGWSFWEAPALLPRSAGPALCLLKASRQQTHDQRGLRSSPIRGCVLRGRHTTVAHHQREAAALRAIQKGMEPRWLARRQLSLPSPAKSATPDLTKCE